MRFFRRIAGFLGFAKEEEEEQEEEQNGHVRAGFQTNFQDTGLPRKGFSVPVQVAVERPQLGPIILLCSAGDGGVQGLKWFAKQLRMDEDGDVADEFLDEVTSLSPHDQQKLFPRFEVKYITRPAKIKKQVMSHDGKIEQHVEYQGRLQWV